jgi:lipoate-protein ligase B/very-short-patch-repair endonuclease
MIVRALGRVDYEATIRDMRAFTDARTAASEDELWIVEHGPVFTQGVAGKPEHLLINPANIPVIKTDRGGQITYHGPGQTIVYVLFDLRRAGFGVRELVMRIENAVVATLAQYGITAYGKRDAPGVYVEPRPLSRSAGEGWGEGSGAENNVRIHQSGTIAQDLKTLAREMRTGATDAEALIWRLLRNRQINGAKFRRQHPVGRYILDFYCDQFQLAIELDGGQHAEQIARDEVRSAWLNARGIRVLRFWNNDVLSRTESVLEAVYLATNSDAPPSPQPSPALRERESLAPLTHVEESKIASLGLKIRNGCSYHGVALNVHMDLTPFSFINPCGYRGLQVTHLHEFSPDARIDDVGIKLAKALETALTAPATSSAKA